MNQIPENPTCAQCGAPINDGVCPRCLMLAAMEPTSPSPVGSRQLTPSLESVQAAFPQLEIIGCIGQGGMGCVFKARQPKLNRFVALKLLPASLAERDAAFAGRFEREGQLLARLHHPNIVAVHDSGTAGEFFYLIMEYVDGVNLRQAMRARRFTPGQALAIVPHICDALQFAHDEGVLHRDIKPENILLDAKGRVKLADFGIAKLLADSDTFAPDQAPAAADLTQSGTALGTPSYMSPEQRDTPSDVDHRADIYSLGVVFYELLTGELPQGPLARPSEKSDADPRVDAIVQQALEKERGRRQQSVGEVKTQVETLAGSASGLPVLAGTTAHAAESVAVARPPRFSRLAIIGAAWVPFMLLAWGIFIFLHTAHEVRPGQPTPTLPDPVIWLMMTVMGIGFAAPLVTTILGWVAFVQIRRSAGRLRGKGLALFDGLLFPSLVVVALPVFWFFQKPTAAAASQSANNALLQASVNSDWIRSHRSGQCITVSHGDAVQFVLYSPEPFGHSAGSGTGADDGSWHEQVNISLLRHGRAFAVSRSSTAPESVSINGTISRLEFGRAFVLGAEGRIDQVMFFPSASEARNGNEMAAKIEKIRREGGVRLVVLRDDSSPPVKASPAPKEATRSGNSSEIDRQFGVSPGSLFKQIFVLLLVVGFLYLVYRVRRRYGWKVALLLVAAVMVLVWMLTIKGNKIDRSLEPARRPVNRAPASQEQLAAPATFESLTGAARKLMANFFPHAVINSGVDEFTAQYATQEFEIHTQFKTGEIAQKAQKQTGPSAKGFMLTVQRLKSPLVTAAADLPQSFDEPYWKRYVNSSFDPKTGQGVAVYFDYGAQLDPDFKRAMLELMALRADHTLVPQIQAQADDKDAELWGEAVQGVQASLRAEREEWGKGEWPAFKLKLRNQGEQSPFVARQQELAEVEIDGEWFMYSGPVDVLSGPIQPGETFDNIAVVLDPKWWQSKEKHEPLALKAGENTVRVSLGLEVKPSVHVISNPIKIKLQEAAEPPPSPPPIPPAALEHAKATQVDVIFYDKNTDGTPYRRLTLYSGGPYTGPGSEPWDCIEVTPEQLARVLDHLAQTRFFDTAKEYDNLEVAKRQPCYILKVRQHGHEFYENLGWGRQTGERLEKLRSVLEGEANTAMSKLLTALNPKLREWEDASWSEVQNGLQLRVEAERPIFKVGDNVLLRFTFRNTTDRPITVLDAQDQMRGTFHQFTFSNEKGEDIAQTSTPDPAWENKGIGEIMVRHEIPSHDMISRTVSLSGWNLAGLGHPYTGIGKEARSFNVTGGYFTRVGLDLKDPKVWLGHIAAKPVLIEIVENHPPISTSSQSADSSPAELAAASLRGKASATSDIKAGRLRILYSGIPWSQGKPLFDDTTGYRVEPLGGCAETPQFRAEFDAYNQTMREWCKSQPASLPTKPAEPPPKSGAAVPAADASIFVTAELSEDAHALVREAVRSVPNDRKNPNGDVLPKRIIEPLTVGKENEIAFGREHFVVTEIEPDTALEKALGRPFNLPAAFEQRTVGITLRLTARRENGRILFSGTCETPQLTADTPTKSSNHVVTTTMLTHEAKFSGVAEAGKPVEVNVGDKDGKARLTLTFSETKPAQ